MNQTINLSHHSQRHTGPVQAVILDWAGTTVDHGSIAPVMAFVETFRLQGVDISPEEARVPMGMQKCDHIRALTKMPLVAALWNATHGRPPDENDVATMYETFIPLQMKVIADYAEPIQGAVETIAELRDQGIRIGSTTGYNRAMMDELVPAAARFGYRPDSVVCSSDVPAGRPEPWMALLSAMELRAFPLSGVVKVGDTVPDIAEGLNAGMWTVAVALTGNELGLSAAELANLSADELATRRERAHLHLADAGAHYVIDGIWSLPRVLEEIDERLRDGEKP
jgi:phosphonoacetaldehyde hydrolase